MRLTALLLDNFVFGYQAHYEEILLTPVLAALGDE
jgi:hypothetical protein